MLLAARGFCYNRTRKGGIPMSVRAYIEPGKIPPAVKELLETLHSRYTLAAASNGPY